MTALLVVTVGLLAGFLLLPVLTFLKTGWPVRRRSIINAMSEEAIEIYLRRFFPVSYLNKTSLGRKEFETHYDGRFGRRFYGVPLFFLGAVSVFLSLVAVDAVLGELNAARVAFLELPMVAIAALAGGYLWVSNDFIGRARRLDLAPVHVNWATFRLIIAAPIGIAVSAVANEALAAPVALFLGAFPTSSLFKILRRLGARQLDLGEQGPRGESELRLLQGINTETAERFVDEGVTTISQLAYCDPVDLTMSTSFSFSYVVDCVSQALAWIYFEDKLPKMATFSARGAQEIFSLIFELDGEDVALAESARQSIDGLAAELKLDKQILERTFREIAEDPYTSFLTSVWQVV